MNCKRWGGCSLEIRLWCFSVVHLPWIRMSLIFPGSLIIWNWVWFACINGKRESCCESCCESCWESCWEAIESETVQLKSNPTTESTDNRLPDKSRALFGRLKIEIDPEFSETFLKLFGRLKVRAPPSDLQQTRSHLLAICKFSPLLWK